MMRPTREVATNNGQAYFVTSNTAGRQCFFRHARWAELLIDVLAGYRPKRLLLHDFVIMPDHFHVLITPLESLEKAVQMIKGGFSFRAKKQFEWKGEVWATSFSDHRIRDDEDYEIHRRYIDRNAVKAGLAPQGEDYPYCSAYGAYPLDRFPQGLKSNPTAGVDGAAEAAPFQSAKPACGTAPFEGITASGSAVPSQTARNVTAPRPDHGLKGGEQW
jgi:putative transposase